MIKSNFVKKICCVFLAIVLCLPLVFFTACSSKESKDEENKPYLIVGYKPYAGTEININSLKTYYGQLIYDDVLNNSKNILEGLVDTYGQGSFETVNIPVLGDVIQKTRDNNPSLNGVDIGLFFGDTNEMSMEDKMLLKDQMYYAQELNKMYYASFSDTWTIDLGFSGLDFSLLGFDPEVEISVPTLAFYSTQDGGKLSLDDMLSFLQYTPYGSAISWFFDAFGVDFPKLTFVHFDKSKNEYIIKTNDAFFFLGGKIGEYNYSPAGSDYNNTINFIKAITNTNYNVIEKDVANVTFPSSGTASIAFRNWKYSLAEGNTSNFSQNCFKTIGNYITAFVNKYKLSFAVELAKIKLVGKGELPTTLFEFSEKEVPKTFSIRQNYNSEKFNLKNLYERATSASATENDMKKFLECASVFIDHYGLTQTEASALYDVIVTKVIGNKENGAFKSENDNKTKNNYKEEINSTLKRLEKENKGYPVLKFFVEEYADTIEEERSVDGYIKSFMLVYLEDIETEVEDFTLEITNQDASGLDYLYWVRCYNKNSEIDLDEGCYVDEENSLGTDSSLEISFGASYGGDADIIECNTVKQFSVSINFNEDDFDEVTFAKLYGYMTNKEILKLDGVQYSAWYFDQSKNEDCSFIEVVFATKDVFSLVHFDISYAGFIANV